MAKRKKSVGAKKTRRSTSLRSSKFNFGQFAGAVAGAVVSKLIIKKLPIGNDLVKSLIPVAVGVVLSNNKNEMLKGAGFGMIAVGGGNLVGTIVPAINGYAGGVLDGIFDFSNSMTVGAADEIMFLNGAGDTLDGTDDGMNGDEGMSGDSTFMAGNDSSYIAGDGNTYMA